MPISYHIDLYRIDTPRQLETLGLDDLIGGNSILLIEWGEKFARFERERDMEISLERMTDKVGEPARSSESHVVKMRGASGSLPGKLLILTLLLTSPQLCRSQDSPPPAATNRKEVRQPRIRRRNRLFHPALG